MRGIRFRVWDEKHRRMWRDESVFDDEVGPCMIDLQGDLRATRCGSVRTRFFEIMQCTGLRDSRNVEIYEGDILERLGVRDVVKRTNGGWNPFIDDCQTDGSWHYDVIGNVYEDPEWLEEG